MADVTIAATADPGMLTTVPGPRAPLTPMELLSAAVERGADIQMLEKLMDMQERWEKNQARKAFDAAMAAAKAVIGPIKKNRSVGYGHNSGEGRTEYRHEDFAEIARTIGPALAANGLSYRFRTASPADGPVSVTCIISHSLGYAEENTLEGPRDSSGKKNTLQAIGSTVTYLQRYTLKAALGLAAENDDDGVAAGGDEPISEAQLGALRDKVAETSANIELFCKAIGVDALPDLRKSRFDAAMAALEARAKKRRVGSAA